MATDERRFCLPDGRLYVGEGVLTEAALRVAANYAGPTEGSVSVKVSANLWEIRDEEGALVDAIRWGEKTTVSGRLSRFSGAMLARLLGHSQMTPSGTLALGVTGDAASERRLVSVLLVCPLPDGEEFSLLARCAPSLATDFSLLGEAKSGIGFTLTTGKGGASLAVRELPDREVSA